jgi:hypothetical protein
MAIRRGFIGLASILVIGICLLGSVPQVTAETLKLKMFNHVTKQEAIPIAGVEGHVVSLSVREGVAVFENGDWAWQKIIQTTDGVKGASTLESYSTFTFLDGATIMIRSKGTVEANPQGVVTAAKINSDINGGTGRFQGIKGTMTNVTKLLPPEKGESGQKAVSEAILTYTLPGK